MSTISVVEADLQRPDHQEAVLRLVNNYARIRWAIVKTCRKTCARALFQACKPTRQR